MRYFAELAYSGSSFHGWQKQPNQVTVQTTLEKGLSTLWNTPMEIVGCGRTDAGVHASLYYAHFDTPKPIEDLEKFVFQWNALIGYDIAIMNLIPVAKDAHARFDAIQRSYSYYVHQFKNPFLKDRSFHYAPIFKASVEDLQQVGTLLMNYGSFYPFCKSNTQVHTMDCNLHRSEWIMEGDGRLVYKISADRFLRGMVRMIVGACMNVALDKLDIEVVRNAMENQSRFDPAWSVPAQGLFLDEIRYPYF